MITGENFAHPTPPKCKNKHMMCDHWASKGKCTSEFQWMVVLKGCALACDTCCTSTSTTSTSTSTSTTTTTTTTTTMTTTACVDENCCDEDQALCSKINVNNATYYCSNPHVASLAQYPKKCKRTCGKCEGKCRDKRPLPWCLYRKERNFCDKYWVKSKCMKTCEKC